MDQKKLTLKKKGPQKKITMAKRMLSSMRTFSNIYVRGNDALLQISPFGPTMTESTGRSTYHKLKKAGGVSFSFTKFDQDGYPKWHNKDVYAAGPSDCALIMNAIGTNQSEISLNRFVKSEDREKDQKVLKILQENGDAVLQLESKAGVSSVILPLSEQLLLQTTIQHCIPLFFGFDKVMALPR